MSRNRPDYGRRRHDVITVAVVVLLLATALVAILLEPIIHRGGP